MLAPDVTAFRYVLLIPSTNEIMIREYICWQIDVDFICPKNDSANSSFLDSANSSFLDSVNNSSLNSANSSSLDSANSSSVNNELLNEELQRLHSIRLIIERRFRMNPTVVSRDNTSHHSAELTGEAYERVQCDVSKGGASE